MSAGVASRVVENAAYNSSASVSDQFGYVYDPKSMAMDAVVGGGTAGILYGADAWANSLGSKGINNGADVQFNQALKTLDKSGLRPGHTEISKGRVMEIYTNYSSMKANSSVYTDSSGRYLVDGHHTTVAKTMLGRGVGMNMNVPTQLPPSAKNVYWHKSWYEFWKTPIKVIE